MSLKTVWGASPQMFTVALGALTCAACSSDGGSQSGEIDNLAAENLVVNDTMAPDPIIQAMAAKQKAHNYADEENAVYSYIAAVSEEDAKQGKAAGDVLLFAFRGVSQGKYTISRIDDDGRPLWDSECSNPCRVIKTYIGGSVTRRAYTPESLIGAAFEDAFNGQLKVKPKPSPASVTRPSEYYTPSTPQSEPPLPSGTADLQSLNEDDLPTNSVGEPL